MADYYKLVSTTNRHTDWTAEVVLEVDETTGEPTKVVRAGEPVQLSAEDRKKVEALGYGLESASKDEVEQFEERAASGAAGDVAGAAPIFGDSEQANQTETAQRAKTDQE